MSESQDLSEPLASEPDDHFVKGRLIPVVPEGAPKPDECVHGAPLARGYWCGECQDEAGRRQAKADEALRLRRAAERRERGL
jgi:hypothetical protein